MRLKACRLERCSVKNKSVERQASSIEVGKIKQIGLNNHDKVDHF
jgi:hypothetical protein